MQVFAVFAAVLACAVSLGWRHGLVAAVLVAPLVLAGVRWLQQHPAAAPPSRDLALALDLVAVALRAGQPLAAALALAAPAAGPAGAQFERTAGLLRLGADPEQAWAAVDEPALVPIAAAARRSADSGIRLARAFERLAVDLRTDLRASAEARARRAEVLTAAPLGLCFLPAFVCLGIAPIIIGVATSVLSGTM